MPNNLFHSIIEIGSIPNQCKELKIDHFLFCHNPLELIPSSVKELKVCHWSSNGGNRNILPSSIEILKINSICQFTNPIEIFEDSLPNSITSLVLKDIEGISNLEIPSSIRQLEISSFDKSQLLPNFIIPSTVDVLSIRIDKYIKPGTIPNCIKELTIYQMKESFEKDLIPESVTKLIFKINSWEQTKIEIKDTLFPRGLIHLVTYFYIKFSKFGNDEFYLSNLNHLECSVKRISIGMFPSTLKKLILKVLKSLKEWEIPIGAFPESLELLSIEIPPNQIFKQGIFPKSLKTLKLDFRNNFNIPDIRDQPTIIPQSLNCLTLSFYDTLSLERDVSDLEENEEEEEEVENNEGDNCDPDYGDVTNINTTTTTTTTTSTATISSDVNDDDDDEVPPRNDDFIITYEDGIEYSDNFNEVSFENYGGSL
eukprot:gene8086-9950_t